MSEKTKLVTDNPTDNVETLLNYAYAKNKEVYLRYADGRDDVLLTEYISQKAKERKCEANQQDVLEGLCMECNHCELALLNVVSIQAAELRERLKQYENTELSPEAILELKNHYELALSKLNPKDPTCVYADEAICPCCSEVIDETDRYMVCVHCGQVIDWRNW